MAGTMTVEGFKLCTPYGHRLMLAVPIVGTADDGKLGIVALEVATAGPSGCFSASYRVADVDSTGELVPFRLTAHDAADEAVSRALSDSGFGPLRYIGSEADDADPT